MYYKYDFIHIYFIIDLFYYKLINNKLKFLTCLRLIKI